MSRPSVSQTVCPLCRANEFSVKASQGGCRACGCAIELDPKTRNARFTRIPDEYAEVSEALLGSWMSRRAMFAKVDALLNDDSDEEEDDDAGAGDEETDFDAGRSPYVLPMTIVSGVLVLACLCMGALTMGGAVLWLRPTPTPTEESAIARAVRQTLEAQTPGPGPGLAITDALTATVVVTAAPPESAQPGLPVPPTPDTTAFVTSVPLESPVTPPALPTPPLAQPITATPAPPATLPPPPTPNLPQPPTPNPAALPSATLSLPPTFTPQPTLPFTPTLPAGPTLTATPTPSPTPTGPVQPTVGPTPTRTPTPTPTLLPGGQVFFGTLRITHVNYLGSGEGVEYVEILNESGQPVSTTGMELRWDIPARGSALNQQPEPFDFPAGNVILGNQTCKIYTFKQPPYAPCVFSWGYTPGNLWPDETNKGDTARLFDANGRELARFTY